MRGEGGVRESGWGIGARPRNGNGRSTLCSEGEGEQRVYCVGLLWARVSKLGEREQRETYGERRRSIGGVHG